jgi:hypothetical protein
MDSDQAGTAPDPGEVTDEMITQRAYEISQTNEAGTPEDNWFRAAQQLRSEAAAAQSSSETS